MLHIVPDALQFRMVGIALQAFQSVQMDAAAAGIAADVGMHQRRRSLQQHQQHNQKLTQICNHLRFRNVCELAYPAKPAVVPGGTKRYST